MTLTIAGGCLRNYLLDPALSITPFSGTGAGGQIGVNVSTGRMQYIGDLQLSKVSMQTRPTAFTARQSMVSFDMITFRSMNTSQDPIIQLSPGLGIDLRYQNRQYPGFINQGTQIFFTASIAAAGRLVYRIGHHGWQLIDFIQVPVLTRATQPGFGGHPEQANKSKTGSFESYFRLKNKLLMRKSFDRLLSMSLQYVWDYEQQKDIYVNRQAMHQLSLAVEINIY